MRTHGYKNCMQGKYKPRNPEKYRGNVREIIYRSQAELQFMSILDENKDVISWASEELSVRYYNPIKCRWSRYFPDFIIHKRNKDTNISEIIMIEIKPLEQTKPPKRGGKMETYMRKMMEWTVNQYKWKAAIEFCKKHKMKFVVVARDEKLKFHQLNEGQLEL